ncbi:MAG TPA: hypothetical protein VFB31_11935 [Pseudolabrys sp.]|nr:hypothetical protein [Pseudolabrys sp.]
MKPRHLVSLAALAAALAAGQARAGDPPSSSTDPGFVPQTGQINPGRAAQPWSATASLPQDKQPPQEQARAALMVPDPVGVCSPGEAAPAGGQSTTGAASTAAPTLPAPVGPIGATLQTMPAKFSQRSDLLDHLPVMAWPLLLNEQQRRQIYQAVMADNSPAAADADALKPASALSFKQTGDVHALPQSLSSIDGLQGLQYVKAKDKVLLVRPANGVVVDAITM